MVSETDAPYLICIFARQMQIKHVNHACNETVIYRLFAIDGFNTCHTSMNA